MTCQPDNIGPTCALPLFPTPGSSWTCPDCGQTWESDTFYWRIT